MPNPVVHFEITWPDGEAAQRFYSELFGWSINAANPMSYGIVDTGGQGINGGISAGEGEPHAMFYVEVDDPATYLKRVEAMGGKTLVDVTVVPDMVTFAVFQDPEGNTIGLVKAE